MPECCPAHTWDFYQILNTIYTMIMMGKMSHMTATDDHNRRVSDEYTIDDLKLMVSKYAPFYGFSKVFLFGSRARGDYSDESDYDFCVVPGDDTDLLSMGGFLMDMEDNLGKEISVVSQNGMKSSFLDSIKPDMRLLYEA